MYFLNMFQGHQELICTMDDLMFTSNRALVVLISSGDKTSRCQVYYSVKNSVLSALHISTAAPVEKMQREMHIAQVLAPEF